MPRRGENIQKVVEVRTRADGSSYEIVRWRTWVDLGVNPVTRKRERTVVSADTYDEARKERRDLLAKRDRGLAPTSAKGWTGGPGAATGLTQSSSPRWKKAPKTGMLTRVVVVELEFVDELCAFDLTTEHI